MDQSSLEQSQIRFAAHIRNPGVNSAPGGIEDRRLAIYRDLFYNNIEGFVSSAFPVLRSLYTDDYWHDMVRDFIAHHYCKTPYFLEISQEFLTYLHQVRAASNHEGDLAFMLELAHYEWVELALDVAECEALKPTDWPIENAVQGSFAVSPLVWCLAYQYPVHRIGPEFIPSEVPQEPTNLLVYRNGEDEVGFMEVNGVTIALIQLMQASPGSPMHQLLGQLAQEMGLTCDDAFINHALDLLQQLHRLDIVQVISP